MAPPQPQRRNSGTSIASAARSFRSATGNFMNMDPPLGFTAGLTEAAAQAPTLGEIRRGSFGHGGWTEQGQLERRRSSVSSVGDGDGPRRPVRRTSSGFSSASGRRLPRRSSAGMGSPIEGAVREEHFQDEGLTESFPPVAEEPTHSSNVDGVNEPFPDMTAQEKGLKTDRGHYEDVKIDDDTVGSQSTPPGTCVEEKRPTTSTREKGKISDESSLPQYNEYPSGYIPPPKIPWTTSTLIGLKAFWKWFCTPLGFFITLYGLNVVAWGGMLFLVLLGYGAAPAMCSKNTPANNFDGCNDLYSPRKIWLEIDSQILTALFCVTAFGLIPWRFRDLYYLLKWRMCSEKKKGRLAKMYGFRRLAGIHRGWFRLPGYDTLDELSLPEYQRSINLSKDAPHVSSSPSSSTEESEIGLAALPENDERIPLPLNKKPDDPLTGVRAPPTAPWKLDFFIWAQVWNTFIQVMLCGFMWGENRFNRPSWVVGFLIALACIIVMIAGVMQLIEGKKVKRVEGIPVKVEQRYEDAEREVGIEMEAHSIRSVERERERQKSIEGREEVHISGKGKEAEEVT